MSKQLLIIGGGHTGSSAALAAARQRLALGKEQSLTIILINPSPYLGIRPRYYEYELEQTQVPLSSFLDPISVKIIVAKANHIDLRNKTVAYSQPQKQQTLSFDSVVLAAGSELVQPNIPGIQKHSFNVDNFINAKRLRTALKQWIHADKSNKSLRIAILGGGLTGIELATELPLTLGKICQEYNKLKPSLETFILDRNKVSTNLGKDPQPYIEKAFQMANVTCLDYASINEIKPRCVIYNQTSQLNADFIISTLGIRANHLSNTLDLEKDRLDRIKVNAYLQIPGFDNCFAAGDFAVTKVDAASHESVMSCQQGRPQGRYAGYNAVSALYGAKLLPYSQPNYVTCVDLGAYGGIYTEGWDRKVKQSGQEAKKIKRHINCERIYPPQNGDLHTLLEAGKLEFIPPSKTLHD